MQIKKILKNSINFIENLFMKNYSCICCYNEIDDKSKFMICDKCNEKLELISGNLCKKCGDKLNLNGICINNCNQYKYNFTQNFSMFYYDQSSAKIIKNLKYGKKKYIAKYIASMLASNFENLPHIDIVCAVPVSKKRKYERGFNQAEVIAKCFCEITNNSFINLLKKTIDTKHQAGATQKERLNNLKDSFAVDEHFKKVIENKTILIIDDVFTTGATLSECARQIKLYKPKKVYTMTFAKTKMEQESVI